MFNALRLCLVLPGEDRRLDAVAGTTKYSAGSRDLYAKRTQIKQSLRSDNDDAAVFVFYPPLYSVPFSLVPSSLYRAPAPNPSEYFDDSGHWSLPVDSASSSLSKGTLLTKPKVVGCRRINCFEQYLRSLV